MLTTPFQVVQKSARSNNVNQIAELQKKLQKSMSKRSIRTCIYIADLGSFLQLSNTEITEYALSRCMSKPDALKSFIHEDLERLSRIIGYMNLTTASGIENDVGNAILQELQNRIDEITSHRFHHRFIRIQSILSMKDIYDLELLTNTLRKDYIRLIYFCSKQLSVEMYKLDVYARLNLATVYTGDLLTDGHLEKMGKFLTDYLPGDQIRRRPCVQMFLEVAKCVANRFGCEVTYAHAVSHFRHADIFVGIDKTSGKAIDVSHLFPPPYTGQLIRAHKIIGDHPNMEVYAFITANRRMFDHETGRMMGDIKQKLQQLELLGFHTVLVSGICVKNCHVL